MPTYTDRALGERKRRTLGLTLPLYQLPRQPSLAGDPARFHNLDPVPRVPARRRGPP